MHICTLHTEFYEMYLRCIGIEYNAEFVFPSNIDGTTQLCNPLSDVDSEVQIHEELIMKDKSKTLQKVYRSCCNSITESVIKQETTETTQAGMKGYECEGEMIFTRKLQVFTLCIYMNTTCNQTK